jgi:diguanylate cyclase (GGDEF)-like protein
MSTPPDQASAQPSDSARWSWLLGAERELRLRLSQLMLAGVLMLGCAVVLTYSARLAGTPNWLLSVWMGLALAWWVLSWVLIRSGWSLRLADPAMTRSQIAYALLLCHLAYPMAGPLRSMVLSTAGLAIVFGAFNLPPAQARGMSWLALVLLLLAMLFSYTVWPRNFELTHDLGILLMAVVFLPGMAALAGRLADMHVRFKQQKAQLKEALQRIQDLATRDALTGLANRRQGEALLQQAMQRAKRKGQPLCVAMIDLDHFKRFNDEFGHAVGDAVLRTFAQAAGSALRATDSLARWGGEEFLLLLEEADTDGAALVIERMRSGVAQAGVEVDGQVLRFTFSAGASLYVPGESELPLLDRADRAMYRAKAAGRNRTELG